MLHAGGTAPPPILEAKPVGAASGYWIVTLRCSEDDHELRYTTDGSEPTLRAALHTPGVAVPGPWMPDSSTTIKARSFNPSRQAPSPCVTLELPTVTALVNPGRVRYRRGERAVASTVAAVMPYVDFVMQAEHGKVLEQVGAELCSMVASGVSKYSGADPQAGQKALATAFGALHVTAPKHLNFSNADARCWGTPGQHTEMAKLYTGKIGSHDIAMGKTSIRDLDGTALFNIMSWCKAFPEAIRGRNGAAQGAARARNCVAHDGFSKVSLTEHELAEVLEGLHTLLRCVAAEPGPHGDQTTVDL